VLRDNAAGNNASFKAVVGREIKPKIWEGEERGIHPSRQLGNNAKRGKKPLPLTGLTKKEVGEN